MIRENNSFTELQLKQEKRRKYIKKYMQKVRAKGIHMKKKKWVVNMSKEKIDMSWDARTLFNNLNTEYKMRINDRKTHKKEIEKLNKTIAKMADQHVFNIDLIQKYQSSQESAVERLHEQQQDIKHLLTKIRKLQNEKLH